ncbi:MULTISPECIES: hypothetical protein [unclassified Mycobacterium]|uniref:hypothetical protein n=1 Tax=unclassified Mycobacterium TaxID=2642494 RepID=UPI0029C828A8|nr:MULTISPECIES: hypothetical protein [unclassified Mycobacterium]
MTSSQRCVAAGAWLLVAGLLSGSGAAVAFADPGSHHGKHSHSASEAKRHAAKSERGTKRDTTSATGGEARETHQDAATTSGVDERPARRWSGHLVNKPTTRITRSATTQVSASAVVADTALINDDTAPANDPTPPTGNAAADEVASSPMPDDPPSTQPAAPPTDDTSAPDTIAATVVVLPTYDASAPTSDQVASASATASSDTTAGATTPAPAQQDASQSTPTPDPTPTAEVTAVSQTEVATPTDTVAPPTEVPAAPEEEAAAVAAIEPAVEDENNRRRAAGLDERGLSPLQLLGLLTRTSGSSIGSGATANFTLLDGSDQIRWGGAASAYGTNAASAGTSPTSTAARTPNAAMPKGLQTFLYTCGPLVVAVSLSAMVLAALPGLAGLIIPTAAGMHIGYRQAKAVRAVRSSGIAHLAASGPIGVVRSGSLIALRPPSRRLPPPSIDDRAHQQEVA